MDKGVSVQNPYGNVIISRAQLKSSFIWETLGEDLDWVVITNPSAVPSYPTYISQDVPGNNNGNAGYRIHTRESWKRPYNPYAGEKPQNGGQSDATYAVDLDKHYKDMNREEKSCGCCCPCFPCCSCCKCCCCCGKPCCVIS